MKNRIKELRARDNLTQLELAKKVNVRRETIVFLEKGKYNPSLKLAYDIARTFGLPIEEVFLFDDPEIISRSG
jgi:putative transcriptional regulator